MTMTTITSSAGSASHMAHTRQCFHNLSSYLSGMRIRLQWHAITLGAIALLLVGAVCVPARAQNVSFSGYIKSTPPTYPAPFGGPEGLAVDGAGDIFVVGNQALPGTPGDIVYSKFLYEIPAGCTVQGCLAFIPNGYVALPPQDDIQLPLPALSVQLDGAGDLFFLGWHSPLPGEKFAALFEDTNACLASGPAYTNSGCLTVVAGGEGAAISLAGANSMAIDGAGDIFLANGGQVYEITGGVQNTVPTTGLGSTLRLAIDATGDLFIADQDNNQVVEIAALGGAQTTVPASGLNAPRGAAVDAAGDVFIADNGNSRVVEVTPGGVQTIIGASGMSAWGLTLDAAGDVFVADNVNKRVLEFAFTAPDFGTINACPAGQSTPAPCNQTLVLNYYVSTTTTFGATNVLTQGAPNLDFQLGSSTCTGTVTAGNFCTVSVAFAPLAPGARRGAVQLLDNSGNLLASNLVHGIGQEPAIAFGPGTQITVPTSGLSAPRGLALDGAGDIFVANTNGNQIVEVTPGGVQSTVPATGLSGPTAVAVDGAGDVLIADSGNNQVVEVTPAGVQTTLPASGLKNPTGVAVDGAGNVYIADTGNNQVVEVTSAGIQTTVPASGLTDPAGVAVDGAGDVYIADYGNKQVVEVTSAGVQTTVPATGISNPIAVALDTAGDVFIGANNQVVEVSPSGVQTTVAVSGLGSAQGAAVDATGDVFIADEGNNHVVEMQLAQNPTLSFVGTPPGKYSSPQSITIQNIGNLPLNAVAPGLDVHGPDFAQVPGSGTPADCTGTFALAPGATCNLSLVFSPPSIGLFSSTAVFFDNAFNASPSATQTIALQGNTLLAQIITFTTPPPATSQAGDLFTVAASGGASGNPVTFTARVGSACTVSIATYTMIRSGVCYVIANQAGSSQYEPAPKVAQSVIVSKTTPTVSFTGAPNDAAYLSTFLVATTENSGVTPTITTLPHAVCTVSGNLVTMKAGTGTCTVKASWATNTSYLAASLTQSTTATLLGTTTTITSTTPQAAHPLKVEVYFAVTNGVTALTGTATVTASSGETCTGTIAQRKCLLTFAASGSKTLTATYSGNVDNSTSTSAPPYPLTVN